MRLSFHLTQQRWNFREQRNEWLSSAIVSDPLGRVHLHAAMDVPDETIVAGFGPRGCVRRHWRLGRNGQPDRHISMHPNVPDRVIGAPTFVTQNGEAVNLTTETGASYRAWPDWNAPYSRISIDALGEVLSIRPMPYASSSTMAASGSAHRPAAPRDVRPRARGLRQVVSRVGTGTSRRAGGVRSPPHDAKRSQLFSYSILRSCTRCHSKSFAGKRERGDPSASAAAAIAVAAAAGDETDCLTGKSSARHALICPFCPASSEKIFCFSEIQIRVIFAPVPSHRGASRDRHGRGAGCGGRGCADNERCLMRTEKSCGPDTPTLVSSSAMKERGMTVAKTPGAPGRARISRKTAGECRVIPV